MDANFWHQKWEKNEIAFHQSEANPLLVRHFNELSLAKGSRVFIPLCGKTRDIAWLLTQGYQVAGAELSKIAIEQLFNELGIKPEINKVGELQHYRAPNIDIFVGDIFELSESLLGPVDAIYDRAALVALPAAMRDQYTKHLMQITEEAPQLLISYTYDQTAIDGPPFSITNEEVHRHYAYRYQMRLLASVDVAGGMKGKCPAVENVWLLKRI
ncbi:MAG TPA: thiopurine S-methyltransferase [Methylophilaceae bacterium]|nr:thiopurine S-methyltransferase [Methylophilaceae bacterium]